MIYSFRRFINISHKLVNSQYVIHIVTSDCKDTDDLSSEDQDMDKRVNAAINAAIQKAKVCNKPIAKYDCRKKKAYIQTPDGVKKYID